MKEIEILLEPGAYIPVRAHEEDAGLDLKTPKDISIYPGARVTVDTLVRANIPKGYAGFVRSKSGLLKECGILTDGTVDAGYTGTIRVTLLNLGSAAKKFRAGDKIAQLVIQNVELPKLKVVHEFDFETERGENGFGSTGR